MQNANEVKSHIRAIGQTRKITNAMHLVSSARIKKMMPSVEYNRLYFKRAQAAMQNILADGGEITHPYLLQKEGERATFIVVSGDKGMVGSYNNDVLGFALKKMEAFPQRNLIAVGASAIHFFRKRGIMADIEIIGASQDPSLHHARHMVQDVFRLYDQDLTDRVYVIYTQFVNSVKWYPCMKQLLPLDTIGDANGYTFTEEMIYHPSRQEVFNLLVPQYTIGMVYGALLNSYASEHCSRMNAMQSATKNADELLEQLWSKYNLIRQTAITQEITEITGAAMALEEMQA